LTWSNSTPRVESLILKGPVAPDSALIISAFIVLAEIVLNPDIFCSPVAVTLLVAGYRDQFEGAPVGPVHP
jgi:hypothetical protein